jgi:hypothetical protein
MGRQRLLVRAREGTGGLVKQRCQLIQLQMLR